MHASSEVAIFFVSRKISKFVAIRFHQVFIVLGRTVLWLEGFVVPFLVLSFLYCWIAISVQWRIWARSKLWPFRIMAAVPSRKGRPRLSGRPCYIRIRSSVFELWNSRKRSLGFAEVTNSVFAEYLLHQTVHWASRLAQSLTRIWWFV